MIKETAKVKKGKIIYEVSNMTDKSLQKYFDFNDLLNTDDYEVGMVRITLNYPIKELEEKDVIVFSRADGWRFTPNLKELVERGQLKKNICFVKEQFSLFRTYLNIKLPKKTELKLEIFQNKDKIETIKEYLEKIYNQNEAIIEFIKTFKEKENGKN